MKKGRSEMKGERSAILQTLPWGGGDLQCFRPSGGRGLQGGRSAIQHRNQTSTPFSMLFTGFLISFFFSRSAGDGCKIVLPLHSGDVLKDSV